MPLQTGGQRAERCSGISTLHVALATSPLRGARINQCSQQADAMKLQRRGSASSVGQAAVSAHTHCAGAWEPSAFHLMSQRCCLWPVTRDRLIYWPCNAPMPELDVPAALSMGFDSTRLAPGVRQLVDTNLSVNQSRRLVQRHYRVTWLLLLHHVVASLIGRRKSRIDRDNCQICVPFRLA